jgi:hypothetical protein
MALGKILESSEKLPHALSRDFWAFSEIKIENGS